MGTTKGRTGRAVRPTKQTAPKRVSKATLLRKVAQQVGWAVVDVRTGEVLALRESRVKARDYQQSGFPAGVTTIVRVDLRVKGLRA